MSQKAIIDYAGLHGLFLRERLSTVSLIVVDTVYTVLNDAVFKPFMEGVSAEAMRTIGSYEVERADCDKFSRAVSFITMVANIKQTRQLAGFACGFMGYTKDDGESHSINVIVTIDDNHKYKVRFFEPNGGYELVLSATEKQNIKWLFI